ncbi:MAG: putative dehydrogenase, partial [Oceanospirillaceae bacterium]
MILLNKLSAVFGIGYMIALGPFAIVSDDLRHNKTLQRIIILSIQLAIIGLGTIGQRILLAAQRHPDVEVVAVFDATPISLESLSLDEAQCSKISVESSAQALMKRSDVDIVYIGTPPNSHMHYCHMALDNNKAIWCEKPLAVNVAESKAFIERLRQTPIKAAVNLS